MELGCDGHFKHCPGPGRRGCAAVVWLDCRWELQGVCRTWLSHASTGCGVSPSAPSASRQRGQAPLTFVPTRPRLSLGFGVSVHTHGSHTSVSCTHQLARPRSFQLLSEGNRASRGRDDQDEGGRAGELCMTPGGGALSARTKACASSPGSAVPVPAFAQRFISSPSL